MSAEEVARYVEDMRPHGVPAGTGFDRRIVVEVATGGEERLLIATFSASCRLGTAALVMGNAKYHFDAPSGAVTYSSGDHSVTCGPEDEGYGYHLTSLRHAFASSAGAVAASR